MPGTPVARVAMPNTGASGPFARTAPQKAPQTRAAASSANTPMWVKNVSIVYPLSCGYRTAECLQFTICNRVS